MPQPELNPKLDSIERLLDAVVPELSSVNARISIVEARLAAAEAATRTANEQVERHHEALFTRNGTAVVVQLANLKTDVGNAHLRITNLKPVVDEHLRDCEKHKLEIAQWQRDIETAKVKAEQALTLAATTKGDTTTIQTRADAIASTKSLLFGNWRDIILTVMTLAAVLISLFKR